MIDAGIGPDDILIVDRALEAVHKRIVIAIVNGEFYSKTPPDREWRILACSREYRFEPSRSKRIPHSLSGVL
jgi:DNA polymerase V